LINIDKVSKLTKHQYFICFTYLIFGYFTHTCWSI